MLRAFIAALVPTVVFLYVVILNPQNVTFRLSKTHAYSLPLAAVVVVLVIAGFVAGLVLMAGSEVRGAIRRAKDKRQWKREGKKRGLFHAALAWWGLRDWEKARGALSRLLSLDGHSLEGMVLMGVVAREEGKLEEALSWHRKARRVTDGDPWLLSQMYRDYVATGEWEDAWEVLETLSSEGKPSQGILEGMMDVALQMGQVEKAVSIQGKILKSVPKEEREEKARAFSWRLYKAMKTIGDKGGLYKIIKRDPTFVPAYVALSEMEEKGSKILDLLMKGCERNPKALVLFERLEGLVLSQEKPGDLIGFYKKLQARYPEEPLIPFLLARLYFSLGMYEDAHKVLSGLSEDVLPVVFLKVLVLGRLEKGEEALRRLSEVLGKKMGLMYRCNVCGCFSKEWREECPGCGLGGTLFAELEGIGGRV